MKARTGSGGDTGQDRPRPPLPAPENQGPLRYISPLQVERLTVWLHNFRRIVTRLEIRVENCLGFVHPERIRMLLRQPAFPA